MRFTALWSSLLSLVVWTGVSGPAWAVTLPAFDLPEIGSIDMATTAKAGDSVQITIKASKDGTSVCGLVVNFGDGSNQEFKVNAENVKLPISVEHSYKKPGKYTVKANGKKVTTHHSCKGSVSATIAVSAPKKSAKSKK
jgi:hypothetical protein